MEVWKAVPGYPGYEVSDLGRVRSLDRVIDSAGDAKRGPYRRTYPGKLLSVRQDSEGYLRCSHVGRVHVLMMLAFVGLPPDGMEVCHINGDKTDIRLVNLRYGTRANNMADAVRHGTNNIGVHGTRYGESNHAARLTKDAVKEIRRDKLHSAIFLAKQYDVSPSAVRRVRRGEGWRTCP